MAYLHSTHQLMLEAHVNMWLTEQRSFRTRPVRVQLEIGLRTERRRGVYEDNNGLLGIV